MRADRIISLLMLLQIEGPLAARELARRLEVSTRTIYRDMDALSASGVPVYAERGRDGGYALLDSYRTSLTGLKEEEVRALFMLTVPGLLADLGAEKALAAARLKLIAAMPSIFRLGARQVEQRLLLDPAGWFQAEEPTPHLATIQDAIWQERRLRLIYRQADGQWIKRLVHPYGLVAKASVWYLVAASYGHISVYRVSRVQEAIMRESHFSRPEGFDLADFWRQWCDGFEASLQRYKVKVQVAPTGVGRLVEAFGEGILQQLSEAGSPDRDGAIELELSFTSAETACRQLLGLAPAVMVVEPGDLHRQMRETAQRLAALYGD